MDDRAWAAQAAAAIWRRLDAAAAPSESTPGKPAVTADGVRRRTPFEVDITAAVHPGRNTLAVRADHTKITELNLGGLIRPVYLVEKRP